MTSNKNDLSKILYEGVLVDKLSSETKLFNNEAYLYKWQKKFYVLRRVGKQYNLSKKQFNRLKKDVNSYYLLLRKLMPSNVPKTFFIDNGDQKYNFILVTENFPKGKITEVKNIREKIKFFKKVIEIIISLSIKNQNKNKGKLLCSIDPNPDNFFIGEKKKVIYNDFTPPFFAGKTGLWFEFRRRDELHVSRSEKEKRYFSDVNILINFLNKIRTFLPFREYLRFVKWANERVKAKKNIHLASVFPKIFNDILKNSETFKKFEKYVTLRDLLRFRISFSREFSVNELKDIYRYSKKYNGVNFLKSKL